MRSTWKIAREINVQVFEHSEVRGTLNVICTLSDTERERVCDVADLLKEMLQQNQEVSMSLVKLWVFFLNKH